MQHFLLITSSGELSEQVGRARQRIIWESLCQSALTLANSIDIMRVYVYKIKIDDEMKYAEGSFSQRIDFFEFRHVPLSSLAGRVLKVEAAES